MSPVAENITPMCTGNHKRYRSMRRSSAEGCGFCCSGLNDWAGRTLTHTPTNFPLGSFRTIMGLLWTLSRQPCSSELNGTVRSCHLMTRSHLGLFTLTTGSPLPIKMFTTASSCSLSEFTSRCTSRGGIWKKSPCLTSTALLPLGPYSNRIRPASRNA